MMKTHCKQITFLFGLLHLRTNFVKGKKWAFTYLEKKSYCSDKGK